MCLRLLPLACTLMMVVLSGAACNVNERIDESPLATWDPSNSVVFNQATIGKGTLDVSEGCVRLALENQKLVLLVWPEPTSWNATSQAIEFVGVRGERLELRDGDQIIPGGATATREPQFVSPPGPSCEAEETFVLHSLRVVTD